MINFNEGPFYIFPFELVTFNSRIVIYGAGNVGISYYSQVISTDYCEVVSWVDKNTTLSKKLPISSVNDLWEKKYDYVVIAIQDAQVADMVKGDLICKGIKEEKILWRNPKGLTLKESQIKRELIKDTQKINGRASRKVILFNTPDHGNIGDHAIALAAEQFIKKSFPKREFVEITGRQWDYTKETLCEKICKEDILFITGGGFMGDLWYIEDTRVKELLTLFSDNKIIFLPQSFYYDEGKEDSNKNFDCNFYLKNKNIMFIHREINSYQNCLEAIQINHYRYPDMALYLKFKSNIVKRNGVLLCLREDKESRISIKSRNMINDICAEYFINYETISTVKNIAISKKERAKMVESILGKIENAQLVITDRLHAMIFCAITGTPCIAMDNVSKKVSGVYEWIKDLPYIKCIEEIYLDRKMITTFMDMRIVKYKKDLDVVFNQMEEDIKQWIQKDG